MFSFADVVHLFAHKFSRLRGRRLSFAGIFAGSLNGFTFGHGNSSLSAVSAGTTLIPIRQFLYRRSRSSPIRCCSLNLLRGRKAVLVAHVEFLEMKIKGADQCL